jgi:two-component system, OmpR family, sensor histidine kinase KdpD
MTQKSPDEILAVIQQSESQQHQGRLKVFLGFAAGVGKTYAMLKAGHLLKEQRVDVVVGIVEHHNRKDTLELLTGLTVFPRLQTLHRGVLLEEMDLQGIILRKPQVVLVDELAHTNAPGSRHSKRYQDVLELLKSGIDVYTTLNVQHIESRVDTIRDITRIQVQETVPDLIIDRANDIVLIDIPPDDLLARLKSGKIYQALQALQAGENFFNKSNLIALREMALRIAAEKVDRDLRHIKVETGNDDVWKASGRLMVAVFASPHSEVLIRWTRRVADSLGVTWFAGYVQNTPHESAHDQTLLNKNFELVKQLGGSVQTIHDDSTAQGLIRLAQQNNVTQLIVGKSNRHFLSAFLQGGSLVHQLIRSSGPIDIYAVATNRAKEKRNLRSLLQNRFATNKPRDFGLVTGITVATWIVASLLEPYLGHMAIGFIFLIATTIGGMLLSQLAVIMIAIMFALIHNFFFIPPKFTLHIGNAEDAMILAMFFLSATIIGHLTNRLTKKEMILQARDRKSQMLYHLTRNLSVARTLNEIISCTEHSLSEALGTPCFLHLNQNVFSERNEVVSPNEPLKGDDRKVIAWVLENGHRAGKFTQTFNQSGYTYFPVPGQIGTVGVLGIECPEHRNLSVEDSLIVETFLSQVANVIDREATNQKLSRAKVTLESQRLYTNLFDCVSHELRTPLSTIYGSCTALEDFKTASDPQTVVSFALEIKVASERLQKLVDNLLDMTRIDSGHLSAKVDLYSLQELLSTAIATIQLHEGSTRADRIEIEFPPHDTQVYADPVLFNQAFSNLIHNALKYSDVSKHVYVRIADRLLETIDIIIQDQGPGLPQKNPDIIFQKFFRSQDSSFDGLGLGLSIAKGFVEAQGGRILAENSPDGGAQFTIRLTKAASH